jgi:hypothetical protein
LGESYSTSLSELFLSPAARVFRGGSKNVSDRDTRNQRLRLIPESRSQLLESMRWPERALFSGSRGVWLPQLNKGKRTHFDPPVIATGRRLKTSACLRFYAVFSKVCTPWPRLKLSHAGYLYQPTRESSWAFFPPLATRLSGVSKSRDLECQ